MALLCGLHAYAEMQRERREGGKGRGRGGREEWGIFSSWSFFSIAGRQHISYTHLAGRRYAPVIFASPVLQPVCKMDSEHYKPTSAE